jgi:hypothetical protein
MLICPAGFCLKLKKKCFRIRIFTVRYGTLQNLVTKWKEQKWYGTVRYAPKFGHKMERAKMETKILKNFEKLVADHHLPPPLSLFTLSPSYRAACGP